MIDSFDKTIGRFRCYYTGLILEEDDMNDPLFLNFDHPVPGDDSRLVACASFINHLKSVMTETEFRTNIPLLASHFGDGTILNKDNFRFEHFQSCASGGRNLHPPAAISRACCSSGRCEICKKPTTKLSCYCKRCLRALTSGVDFEYAKPALVAAYDESADGFRCHYTGMLVDLNKFTSPYFLNYDHRFPGQPGNVVVCLFIINMMKCQLSDEEFVIIVRQVAKHFTTGEPFDLGGVKFEYWKGQGTGTGK